MGEGTAQLVYHAMQPTPYSVREVENTLDELVVNDHRYTVPSLANSSFSVQHSLK
jgi:hypothetical protein